MMGQMGTLYNGVLILEDYINILQYHYHCLDQERKKQQHKIHFKHILFTKIYYS